MGIVTASLGKRWPGSVVHYKIGHVSASTATDIQNAINTIEANTTFSFVVRNRQRNYVEFWERNVVDPLPGPAVVEGTWRSIRTGHQLINLDGNRVLDWEPGSGHYRIWNHAR